MVMLQSHSGSAPMHFAVHAPLRPSTSEHFIAAEGSGGSLVPQAVFDTTGSPVILHIVKPDPLRVVLMQIETVFGLTRDELAKVCGTVRKTVYNWLDGKSEPRKTSLQRLFELNVIARDWSEAGYASGRTDIRQPLVSDRSILDMLCEEPLDRELIMFAGSRLSIKEPSIVLSNPFAT